MNRHRRPRESCARLTENANAIVRRFAADALASVRKVHWAAGSAGIATFRRDEAAAIIEWALGARCAGGHVTEQRLTWVPLPVN